MPKYYCDYCETSLTHDSPSVRKTHNQGKKHKENVRIYYNQWIGDKAQNIIDFYVQQYKLAVKKNPALAPGWQGQQPSVYVNPMIPAPLLPPPTGVPRPDGTLARPPMPDSSIPPPPMMQPPNMGYPMMMPPQGGQMWPPPPGPGMMPPGAPFMPPYSGGPGQPLQPPPMMVRPQMPYRQPAPDTNVE
ncbi:U1 small nuclear ribonucleoprotein C [Thelohanellus kitauei]|uniref:U1 small nuclear ribonucleoprotein C n=1 Tax=Thelohanellus kitauei TaxID=669202 RepID=A0A0C2IJW3_THEKT|nr:U1 small nuclear ribonucleoprotein C [Thelohanellus kitauei]